MTTRTDIPTHIRRHLEATGVLARDGISRRAKTTFCADCHRPVVRGLDADVAALVAVVDPAPLTPVGEVLALAAGRRTYDLTWRGARYELDPREPGHIRTRPASRKYHVTADHQCGNSLPAFPPEFMPAEIPADQPPF